MCFKDLMSLKAPKQRCFSSQLIPVIDWGLNGIKETGWTEIRGQNHASVTCWTLEKTSGVFWFIFLICKATLTGLSSVEKEPEISKCQDTVHVRGLSVRSLRSWVKDKATGLEGQSERCSSEPRLIAWKFPLTALWMINGWGQAGL